MAERKIPYGTHLHVLKFLYKWKMATTSALLQRFFSMVSPITGYQFLLKMKKRELIDLDCDGYGQHWAWTLTSQGFQFMRELTLGPMENGVRSEHFEHDLLVSAVHLGDWVKGEPEGVELFSEQELRRYPQEFYPDWVPKENGRRPDGYWRIHHPSGIAVIPLEVELSLKRESDYSEIGHFYESLEKKIFRVVWVVNSTEAARKIQKGISKYCLDKDDRNYHIFFLRKDFVQEGWDAKIVLGREADLGKSLYRLLHGKDRPNCDQNYNKVPCSLFLLDTRKSPGVTAPNERFICTGQFP